MNINVNLDNVFDVISLSTEDDSSSDGDSNDSDIEVDDAESNSSNENSGGDSDEMGPELEQQEPDEDVGWVTTSETED